MSALNPGQWTVCHALKCKDLRGMECAGECQYKSEREKLKAVNAMRRQAFVNTQEKQNAPRIAQEKANFEAMKAKKGGRS